jgi:molybdopterin converting factor small subunit
MIYTKRLNWHKNQPESSDTHPIGGYMVIKIKYFGLITENLPSEANLLQGSSVSDLIDILSRQEPEFENIISRATILVNNSKADLKTTLNNNDEVMILAVLGGG